MIDAFRPVETELGKHEFQNLEMIVLLIPYHIYVGIKIIFGESAFCSAKVLCHIDRRAIGTKQELAVEAIGCKVAPHASVGILDKNSTVKPLLYKFLSEQIGIMLIICPVKTDSECLVGLVESVENPAVHLLP